MQQADKQQQSIPPKAMPRKPQTRSAVEITRDKREKIYEERFAKRDAGAPLRGCGVTERSSI
jgi:hypothetical protein